MAVPFGFSFGDFVAGTNLIITSINAIKDGNGSSSEYRAVTATLKQVSAALEGLNNLTLDDATHRRALEVAASQCSTTIFRFVSSISKYKSSLESPVSVRSWKAAVRKVEWSLYSKEEVRRFQAQLQGDLLALQTTLQTVHLSIMASNARDTRSALIRVERRLDQASETQLLITRALSRCFEEFRGVLMIVFLTNMRIINVLLSGLQPSTQVQDERPIYLDDPHSRVIPFLRSWITDWEDFETILKVQFRRVPGLRKILAQEYSLREGFGSREITRSTSIDSVFIPGRRIIMSMVFTVQNVPRLCPKCFSSVGDAGSHYTEMKCATCGLFFSTDRKTQPEGEHKPNIDSPSLPIWRYEARLRSRRGFPLQATNGTKNILWQHLQTHVMVLMHLCLRTTLLSSDSTNSAPISM